MVIEVIASDPSLFRKFAAPNHAKWRDLIFKLSSNNCRSIARSFTQWRMNKGLLFRQRQKKYDPTSNTFVNAIIIPPHRSRNRRPFLLQVTISDNKKKV